MSFVKRNAGGRKRKATESASNNAKRPTKDDEIVLLDDEESDLVENKHSSKNLNSNKRRIPEDVQANSTRQPKRAMLKLEVTLKPDFNVKFVILIFQNDEMTDRNDEDLFRSDGGGKSRFKKASFYNSDTNVNIITSFTV